MIIHGQMDDNDFAQMIIDQTDEMLEQSKAPDAAALELLHQLIMTVQV